MNISSKRFKVWTESANPGTVWIRDRNAPAFCHNLSRGDLPNDSQLAAISESKFDSLISKAIQESSNV